VCASCSSPLVLLLSRLHPALRCPEYPSLPLFWLAEKGLYVMEDGLRPPRCAAAERLHVAAAWATWHAFSNGLVSESTAAGGSKPVPPHSACTSNWWHQPHGPPVDPALPSPSLMEHRGLEKLLSSLLCKPYLEPSLSPRVPQKQSTYLGSLGSLEISACSSKARPTHTTVGAPRSFLLNMA